MTKQTEKQQTDAPKEAPPSPHREQFAMVKAAALDSVYDEHFPIFQRALSLILIRRAFILAISDDGAHDALQYWHKLLIENAKLPSANAALAPTQGQDLLDLVWDVFGVPQEERARRRAAVQQPQPPTEAKQ